MEDAGRIPPPLPMLARLGISLTPAAFRDAAIAGLGGFAAIAVLEGMATLSELALIIPPFGASAVLLFALPGSPLARPRNVIGGHVVSALVGLAVVAVMGPTLFAMSLGVGLAIAAMRLTGTLHPPAGANPILVTVLMPPWWFVAIPVALGAAVLVLAALAYHRFVSGQAYPLRSG